MKKVLLFLPLAMFLTWASWHLATPDGRPFILRWIDVSMAFFLALVATLWLKNRLFKDHDDGDGGGNP